jgi:ABC-type nitrate/sulfonate/bicarbonate transport system ATPase subunit
MDETERAMSGTPVIEVSGLGISYGRRRVLDAVDFRCGHGEFVAIVGRSGTGKSSFLNAIADFIPYEGTIAVAATCGYVFQSFSLFPWMTVEDNIAFGLLSQPASLRRSRVGEMLARIEMSEYARRYPMQLSGGQVQRVALARALAPDPAILLMDEPYSSLDHLTREKMQSWLLSLWNEMRKTVLFVTHYIEEAIFLADRVVVLRDGRFVKDIAVPYSRPRHDDLRFTERFLDFKHLILDHMGN